MYFHDQNLLDLLFIHQSNVFFKGYIQTLQTPRVVHTIDSVNA